MSAREKKTVLLEYFPEIESKLTAYECNQILNAMEDYSIDFKLNGNLNEVCGGKKQPYTDSNCNIPLVVDECDHDYSDGTGTGYNVCKKCGDMY